MGGEVGIKTKEIRMIDHKSKTARMARGKSLTGTHLERRKQQ